MGGDDLSVQVGQADLVVIDQVQGAHAAAGQSLHGVAPHAADAEDSHPGFGQGFHSGLSQQQLGSGKFIEHNGFLTFISN